MADVFSKSVRSEIMGRIRGAITRPEMMLRSFLHIRGFRFRLHAKALPGKPDIVLPRYKTAIFVTLAANLLVRDSSVWAWEERLSAHFTKPTRCMERRA